MTRAAWTGLAVGVGLVVLILFLMSFIPEPRLVVADEWRRGWNAAKYAIAAEGVHARTAAMRVDGRLNECLGRGNVWSDRHRTCDD